MLNAQSNLQSNLQKDISFQISPGRNVNAMFMQVYSSSFGVYQISGYIKSENRLHKFAYKSGEETLNADTFSFEYCANKCILIQKGQTVFDQRTATDAHGIIAIEFVSDIKNDIRSAIIINIHQKGEKNKSSLISSSDNRYVDLVHTIDKIIRD